MVKLIKWSASYLTLIILVLYINDSSAYHMLPDYHTTLNRTRRQATVPCSGKTFRCNTGNQCIPRHKRCDGYVDCNDSSDENTSCRTISTQCPGFAFQCSYGACVAGDAECNGKQECADNSDENTPKCPKTATSNSCGPRKFMCANGDCIDNHRKCNGVVDCADGSDEISAVCQRERCPPFSYQCSYGGCVVGDAECNGVLECADGSDEDPKKCGTAVTPSTLANPTDCLLPRPPANGRYTVSGGLPATPGAAVREGTYLEIACDAGRELVPRNKYVSCIKGEWAHLVPACIGTCEKRVSDTNNIVCKYGHQPVDCDKRHLEGTVAIMSCKEHYIQQQAGNSNEAICKDSTWDLTYLTCTPECGNKFQTGASTFVVEGQTAEVSEFPWHLGIYRKLAGETEYKHICGGTIITTNVFISAAHCFSDTLTGVKKKLDGYYVAAGKYFRNWDDPHDKLAHKTTIMKLHFPVEYRGLRSNFANDLAIAVVKDRFQISKLIQPICLDYLSKYETEQLADGQHGTVVGWGVTEEEGRLGDNRLKKLTVPYVEPDTCFDTVPPDYTTYITTDKICAGYTNGSSVCQGDSGGGLVFLNKHDDKFYLRGVVSNGPNKGLWCDTRQVGVYTRISKFMDLIKEVERNSRYL